MFRLFGLLLVGLVLAGCQSTGIVRYAYASAGNDDATLCLKAFNRVTNKWKRSAAAKPFVNEAKKQGLNCSLNETSNKQFASISDVLLLSTACKNGFFATDAWSQPYVTEAKSRNLACFINGELSTHLESLKLASIGKIEDTTLCIKAFNRVTNKWKRSAKIEPFVKEAKKRGVNCLKQTASSTTTQSNTPTSARLTAAQKEAERLRQELAALKAQQEQQQQTISNDTQIPLITITQSVADGRKGTIKGYAKDNVQIAEVLIDGQAVRLGSNGSFEWSGFVPATGKDITIEAIDTAALSSIETVTLTRGQIQQASGPRFDDLNPTSGKRVKRNDNALALIVGIADYERTDAPAIYADKDAQFFHDYASLKLGIPESNITTMVNDKAEQGDVILAVKDWMRRSSKPGKSDVYVFFAGHGLASQDGEEMYLLPYDGRPRLLEDSAISRERLFADISAANPRSVTVFLDTCYSGTTRGTDMLIASRPIAIRALEQSIPDNFTVMTAAAGDQTAKPLEEAKHGMFSYFLMKGMEGEADANNDNEITAGELHSYVQTNVIQQSSGSQTPELQGDADRVLVRFK
jgi:hypothetical protein